MNKQIKRNSIMVGWRWWWWWQNVREQRNVCPESTTMLKIPQKLNIFTMITTKCFTKLLFFSPSLSITHIHSRFLILSRSLSLCLSFLCFVLVNDNNVFKTITITTTTIITSFQLVNEHHLIFAFHQCTFLIAALNSFSLITTCFSNNITTSCVVLTKCCK